MPLFLSSKADLVALMRAVPRPVCKRRGRSRRRSVSLDPLEVDFQQSIVDLAALFGWVSWHDQDSRRNKPGFLDLVLWRPPRLLVVEVKRASRCTTAAQRLHLSWWLAVGAEAVVWRPTLHRRERWPLVETAEGATLPPLWGGPARYFEHGSIGRRLWASSQPDQVSRDAAIVAAALPPAVLAAVRRRVA